MLTPWPNLYTRYPIVEPTRTPVMTASGIDFGSSPRLRPNINIMPCGIKVGHIYLATLSKQSDKRKPKENIFSAILE